MVAQTCPEEIARCGEAIYDRDIRAKVEPDHVGEFVVVDVVTGEYEVDQDDLTASHRLLARSPEAVMYGIRIGFPAAYRIRGFMSEFPNVSAWSNGKGAKGTFGIRVGESYRDRHFERNWKSIEVEIDGNWRSFRITTGFWNKCPEIRDSGETTIRNWLGRYHTLKWPKWHPPRFHLLPVGEGRFRLIG